MMTFAEFLKRACQLVDSARPTSKYRHAVNAAFEAWRHSHPEPSIADSLRWKIYVDSSADHSSISIELGTPEATLQELEWRLSPLGRVEVGDLAHVEQPAPVRAGGGMSMPSDMEAQF